jgi:hypothetical protein
MPGRHYALTLLFVALTAVAAMAQPSLAPEAGVLLLRNGQVIAGEVTRAGDYYIVTAGQGSELRLKADDVEAFCGSLVEAYEWKVRRLPANSAKGHVELAKWCLRQELHAKCSEQLVAAMRLEPNNTAVKDLETRLKLAVETPPPAATAYSTAIVGVDDLEKAIHALPRASIEKFGAIVQPILLNRCGANQCHGPNAKSEFRLLRPPPGQIVSRRFTQRNLYEAVQYLDQSNPDASPLVAMPQQRHGSALTPVFDKQSAHQLAELVAWARMTIAAPAGPAPPAPRTIAPTGATLLQPAAKPSTDATKTATATEVSHAADDATSVRVMRPPLDAAAGTPSAQRAPRDPYDAEPFNRHYHGR